MIKPMIQKMVSVLYKASTLAQVSNDLCQMGPEEVFLLSEAHQELPNR